MTKQNQIQEAIMEVIVFFDIFSFPLTDYEIWQYLKIKCEIMDVIEAMPTLNSYLETREGFYFLKGRSDLVDERKRRFNHSARKFKRAIWVTWIFSTLPWIEMVAIGNIIGSNNLKDSSDIDFFIISKSRRLWLTRFVTTFITKFLSLRPKVNDARDKVCLSFYISEEAMDFKKILLENEEDKYFLYWLAGLTTVYDHRNNYRKLINKNKWIFRLLPNWHPATTSRHRGVVGVGNCFYKDILEMLFGGLEKTVKKFQLRILPSELKSQMNKDTSVVISDQVLKMHVNDKRKEYSIRYFKKLNELNINI